MGKNNFCGTLKVFKSIDNYRVDSSQYWEAIASSTVDAIDSMVIWNMKNVSRSKPLSELMRSKSTKNNSR